MLILFPSQTRSRSLFTDHEGVSRRARGLRDNHGSCLLHIRYANERENETQERLTHVINVMWMKQKKFFNKSERKKAFMM
jgi:hypothetical protein